MASETISIIKEECSLDEILNELPHRVAKPTPTVTGKNFSKFLHQISDSLKDLHLGYTCLDASSVVIALGTTVGNAFIYQRNARKILKISSDTKYVPATCIKLAVGSGTVAFGHGSGTFSVGFVDPPIHRSFDSLTAQDIHHKAVTCLEWSTDGLILYAGDCEGNISMSVVKISEGILQTAIIFKEDAGIVQLSYAIDALLVSTTKRTLLWSFQSEEKVQVGEKERKVTGSFGGCFIPESLQDPSKKLYAARPGQRIWAADESGKVGSTSVFKSLLADKPQTIYTLAGNDSKMNSGGQFGALLVYDNKFVVTWDQNHLWVLDLNEGAVIGCHSNLGKIRDVAVSGHELFVLLNQRESFLQRFTLVNENVGPSSLEAVIAIPSQDESNPFFTMAEKSTEEAGSEPVPSTTVQGPQAQDQTDLKKQLVAPAVDDVFQRINSIPLDCGKTDIVFTAAKKKKKKKVKPGSPSEETKPITQDKHTTEPSSSKEENTISTENVTIEDTSNPELSSSSGRSHEPPKTEREEPMEPTKMEHGGLSAHSGTEHEKSSEPSKTREPTTPETQEDSLNLDHDTDKAKENSLVSQQSTNRNTEVAIDAPSTEKMVASAKQAPVMSIGSVDPPPKPSNDKNVHSTKQPSVMSGDGGNSPPKMVVLDEVTIPNKNIENVPTNDESVQTLHGLEDTARSAQPSNEIHAKDVSSPDSLCAMNSKTVDKDEKIIADDGGREVEASPPVQDKSNLDFPAFNERGIRSGATSPGLESVESGDESLILEESSNYLRSDSYEAKSPAERPSNVRERDNNSEAKQDLHMPLFADTWSKRALPTTQIIESLAISENHVFCVNARGAVYYSHPGTASSHGWEEVDWKAKQLYVDDMCGLVSYLGNENKAYIRANVSSMYPVGDKSLYILSDVAALASCFECTWALTMDGRVRKANTSTLLQLKGDLKNSKIWSQQDSFDKLCQIACYHGVVWGRTLDETLCVYTARPDGRKSSWVEVEEMKAKWLNMSDDGTIWIITPVDEIWFKPGISSVNPKGEVWYQVSLGHYIIDDPSVLGSAFNFFYSVGSAYRNSRTTEYLRHAAKGLLQSTKDMACSLFKDGGNPKQIYCNTQSGVWLLDTNNALHACRSQVTGAYWEPVSPTGTAHSATWRQVSTGLGSVVWALQPNGELTCFNPKGPSYNVEGPSIATNLDFITSSPHGVWCFASERPTTIYVRDGISGSYPQGFAWIALPLKLHEIESVRHISVGRITVWAVDNEGNPWLRIGSVCGDDSTVFSQAWVPMDGPPNAELSRIEVNAEDNMVWATDTGGNVYARNEVKDDNLIGTGWREVSGATLKGICLGSCVVYGLCTNGEIVCRFGVSPTNSVGDYWKKIPGNFAQLSINDTGELWAIGHKERLHARKTKCLFAKMAMKEVVVKKEEDDDGEELTKFVSRDDNSGNQEVADDEDGDWELL